MYLIFVLILLSLLNIWLALEKKTIINKILIRELFYADDAAMVTHFEVGLQCLMSRSSVAREELCLVISSAKQISNQNTCFFMLATLS